MSDKLHPSDVVEVLSPDEKTVKRAQWEGFDFTLLGDGDIEVVNTSHEKPEEHTYTVHVEGDIPSDCTCPAWEYHEGACKHMLAVAIREPVLNAATAEPELEADGGVVLEEERPEDCDCSPLFEDLPCWPCYREGYEEPAEVSDE